MHLQNIVERSQTVKVNDRFDLDVGNLMELVNGFSNPYDLAMACFQIGYMQGVKAEKAERRQRNGNL